jgi:hypothetical protein
MEGVMNILQRSLRAKSCFFLLLIPFYSFFTPAIRFLSLSGRFGLFWALMFASPVCGKLQLKQTDPCATKSHERGRCVFSQFIVLSVCNWWSIQVKKGDMKKTITCLLLLLALVCNVPVALAGHVVGEAQLFAPTWEPVTHELVFSDSGYADFILKVRNGEADSSQRTSRALITLNDVKVLIPADFNPYVVETLVRAISPLPGENTLAITVRSHQGASMLVQILGTTTFQLPPDPGPDGEATLEGVDVNSNGIRDDIERWIYLTYPDSEKLRRALIQEYYPMQNMIIHGHQQDRDAVYNDMDAMQRSSECLMYVHPDKPHWISAELKARIVNTDNRFDGYMQSSRMLGGGTFQGVPRSKWKSSCNFNPDELN